MNDTLRMKPEDLGFIPTISQMQKAVSALRPFATQFNKLSVDGATQEYETNAILETLKTVGKSLSSFGSWQRDALVKLDLEFGPARDEMRNLVNIATVMETPSSPRPGIDPRKLLHLDTIANEIIPWIGSIWFTIKMSQPNLVLTTYLKLTARVTANICEILNDTLAIFSVPYRITDDKMEDFTIKNDPHVLKFVLHDGVVAFNEEEIAEQKRLEEIEAENARRAAELEEAKANMKSSADEIINAYNKHLSIGNLKKFKLTETALQILKDPQSIDDLNKCQSLYRFLMAMSNSVRYMPGEDGLIKDRIMGSFMELENDILTYKQQFTLYLHEYNLTHNDIVIALSMFSEENGKIVAQYVDSKDFVEDFMENPKSPKTLHLFVMN